MKKALYNKICLSVSKEFAVKISDNFHIVFMKIDSDIKPIAIKLPEMLGYVQQNVQMVDIYCPCIKIRHNCRRLIAFMIFGAVQQLRFETSGHSRG